MRVRGLIFTIVVMSLSTFALGHPLKMSFSKLMISADGNVELETRIFLDDLTAHMQNLYGLQQPDFSTTTSNATQTLERYLQNHFYFEQDGKKLNILIYRVSLSKNRLALVVNMNTTNPLDVSKEVFLVNTLLCDATPMQTNDIKYLNEHYKLSITNPKVKIRIN